MEEVGRHATSPGSIYFTGGATAVLIGWRSSTIDVDMKLDPEPGGVFDIMERLKKELDMNVELASPEQFIPELPAWKTRSQFIQSYGAVEFYHYDFYAQALSKIERGHAQDVVDVQKMLELTLVDSERLRRFFSEIRSGMKRYPAIEPTAFEEKLEEALLSFERSHRR